MYIYVQKQKQLKNTTRVRLTLLILASNDLKEKECDMSYLNSTFAFSFICSLRKSRKLKFSARQARY